MASTPTNLKMGDVEVYIDYGDGETHLGYTKGGVEFTFEREFEDFTVDQHGSAPLDMALTGQNLLVKATLAEPTTSNLSHAAPEGLYAANGADSKIGFGRDAGYLLSANAGALRLHPRTLAPSDRDTDVYIFKAVSIENVELAYKIDEQRVISITWRALVDTTQPNGQRLGRIGDADIS